ncbi:hypothetical protein ACS0TY_034125 [Phlomoides rotata]
MALVPNLGRQIKLAMQGQCFLQTPRKSHNLPATLNLYGHHLLDEMPQRDVKSATTLIGHFAKQNQHRKPLNLSNINDALIAFQDIKEPNVFSYAMLLRAYTKEGHLAEAEAVFRSMPERNVVAWNTMISGCSQSGKNEEAVNLLIEMYREGVTPTQSTYPCAVIAAANIGSLGLGRSVHACAMKILGNPGLFLANSLISFYAKCGSMKDSRLVFDKMSERNVVSWNALICGFA